MLTIFPERLSIKSLYPGTWESTGERAVTSLRPTVVVAFFRSKFKTIQATVLLTNHTSRHEQSTRAEGGWHFTIIGKVDSIITM